jgi:hypothetical protein
VNRIKRFVQGRQWWLKQRLAGPGRYYGDGGTIHHTGKLDIEIFEGQVVAVWFRCQPLPFRTSEADRHRAADMLSMYGQDPMPDITGVELVDRT